jgi:peptidoglycan/LPS O-acetylase OafA/YrhL
MQNSGDDSEPQNSVGLDGRITTLDGLRGLAILMVLMHHFVPYRAANGAVGKLVNGVMGLGWTGVDLFFVLSGFLITGILYDAKGTDRYFCTFYARRAIRIFPLYYAFVFLAVFVLPELGLFPGSTAPASSWPWWVYLSNFRYAFDPHASQGWLQHFWSLAIEEHFYLAWPAVIFLCNRRGAMAASLGCIALAWIARALFIAKGNELAPYLLTPCRMDALACGALVALATRGPAGVGALVRFARPTALVCGAAALTVGTWRHSICWDPWMQSLGFPLVDLFYAALLIIAITATQSGWLRTILQSRVLTSFGGYSYAIYVFHAAVAATFVGLLGGHWEPLPAGWERANDAINFIVLTFLSFAVAVLSWHLFEKHFLRLKRFVQYRSREQRVEPRPIQVGTMVETA